MKSTPTRGSACCEPSFGAQREDRGRGAPAEVDAVAACARPSANGGEILGELRVEGRRLRREERARACRAPPGRWRRFIDVVGRRARQAGVARRSRRRSRSRRRRSAMCTIAIARLARAGSELLAEDARLARRDRRVIETAGVDRDLVPAEDPARPVDPGLRWARCPRMVGLCPEERTPGFARPVGDGSRPDGRGQGEEDQRTNDPSTSHAASKAATPMPLWRRLVRSPHAAPLHQPTRPPAASNRGLMARARGHSRGYDLRRAARRCAGCDEIGRFRRGCRRA